LCNLGKGEEKYIKEHYLIVANSLITDEYKINDNNKGVITELLKYFTGNGELDLNKGIYLYGDYGTGKTIIFEAVRCVISDIFPFNPNGYLTTSVERIIEHYKIESNLVRFGYSVDDIPINLCINEFGKVVQEKIYGTDVNKIIESLFMIRYELFQLGKLTHVTSNVSPQELNYPALVKDRMSEMFNFIEIKGKSFR